MSRPRPSKKHHRLAVQRLEDRTVPAVFGNPWADPQHLTVSFVPDGTMVNGAASNLFQSMPGQSATWQREILRALQTWVAAANIDVDLVSDSGASIGTRGPTQGDSRFGDIRVAARPLSDNVLAITCAAGLSRRHSLRRHCDQQQQNLFRRRISEFIRLVLVHDARVRPRSWN